MTSTASTPWHSLKSSLWPRLIVLSLDILLATPFLTERARVRLAKSRAKRQALLLYLQMDGALLPLKTGAERDTVVLLVHEMSRTGAPILAWNILRELHRHNLNVVVVALGDGQIEPYFRRDSDLLLLFPFLQMIDARNRARIAHGIINAYKPAYCIANSVGTSSLAHELAIAGLPIVGLVHEFSSYAHHYIPNIVETLESLHIAVFPA